MMRKNLFFRMTVGLLAATLLTGCTRGLDDLEQFVAEVKKRPAKPIEPMPEIKPYIPFTYAAYDLRDPFSIPEYENAGSVGGLRPDTTRRREPLENYPLDGLNMMGVIEKNKRQLALVQSSDGTIHQVAVGNYAGQNFGRITNIQEDHVDLIEIIADGMGGWIERPATIRAREEGTQGKKP
ncbi:MAG: pilus assembly protein PilP [Pseudomonadota bacterium]